MNTEKQSISSSGDIRNVTIQARCTREVKERIKASAEASGKSLTEFIIHKCLPEIEAEKIHADDLKSELKTRIIYQESVNQFVNYVRSKLGWCNQELENEIKKMREGKVYGHAASDGTFRL